MKTNKIIFLLLGFVMTLIVLVGCSGSKPFQGKWKVQDASGDNSTIIFTEKKLL